MKKYSTRVQWGSWYKRQHIREFFAGSLFIPLIPVLSGSFIFAMSLRLAVLTTIALFLGSAATMIFIRSYYREWIEDPAFNRMEWVAHRRWPRLWFWCTAALQVLGVVAMAYLWHANPFAISAVGFMSARQAWLNILVSRDLPKMLVIIENKKARTTAKEDAHGPRKQ